MAKEEVSRMVTTINALVASEHVADLRRAADRRRRFSRKADTNVAKNNAQILELRVASPDDAQAVRRLAALDDAPTLEGGVLIALHDGDPVAALSLDDGRVVADPFVLSDDAVEMLRLRAKHLRARRSRRHLRVIRGLRAA
jgi:hypothetical protein